MATFFRLPNPDDLTAPSDVVLIFPEEIRAWKGLAAMVDQVEEDIIVYFTRRVTEDSWRTRHPGLVALDTAGEVLVYLKGFSQTVDDIDPLLLKALRKTIAEVVAWRVQQQRRDKSVHSQHTTEGKFIRYRYEAMEEFPPRWNWRLNVFNLLDPASHI